MFTAKSLQQLDSLTRLFLLRRPPLRVLLLFICLQPNIYPLMFALQLSHALGQLLYGCFQALQLLLQRMDVLEDRKRRYVAWRPHPNECSTLGAQDEKQLKLKQTFLHQYISLLCTGKYVELSKTKLLIIKETFAAGFASKAPLVNFNILFSMAAQFFIFYF